MHLSDDSTGRISLCVAECGQKTQCGGARGPAGQGGSSGGVGAAAVPGAGPRGTWGLLGVHAD